MYDSYKKFITALNKILEITGISLMILMLILISYQIFMRFVLNNAPSWTEEFSIFLTGWFVYLGIVVGVNEGLHISIEMLVARFPKKIAFWVEIFVNVLIGVAAFLLAWHGMLIMQRLSGNRLPATGISVALVNLPLVIAGILIILSLIAKVSEQFVQRRSEVNG